MVIFHSYVLNHTRFFLSSKMSGQCHRPSCWYKIIFSKIFASRHEWPIFYARLGWVFPWKDGLVNNKYDFTSKICDSTCTKCEFSRNKYGFEQLGSQRTHEYNQHKLNFGISPDLPKKIGGRLNNSRQFCGESHRWPPDYQYNWLIGGSCHLVSGLVSPQL